MPGIPYASSGIEAEAALLFGRDRDQWQQQPQRRRRLDYRVPLLPINCQVEAQAPRAKKFSAAGASLHDSSAMVLMNSNSSENDLATMVHDFMENEEDGYDSSDKESTAPRTGFAAIFEKLKAFISAASPVEKELRSTVIGILFSMSEDRLDGLCRRGIDCNGRCLRSFLVKRLRKAGYDAGICKSRWQSVGRVPGGEYEYIDVETPQQRLVVDLDFHSHFEIARPIQHYKAAVRALPTPFVGTPRSLRQILKVMSDAAKLSLKQNSMHLPPWRTFDYVSAKWFSAYDRDLGPGAGAGAGADGSATPASDWPSVRNSHNTSSNNLLVATLVADRKRCCEQLKRTKACLMVRQEFLPNQLPAQSQSRGRQNAAAGECQR